MNTALRLLCLLAYLTAGGILPAQPVVTPPNFDVQLLAGGIPMTFGLSTMAVDRFGNVYVLDEPPQPMGIGPRVHRIRRNGVVDLDHAVFFGDTGQMAYHPLDGHVYVVETQPILPVINSTVHRIEPGGGATMVVNVPVVAEGFTIDNAGNMFFGGMGLQGPGLYMLPAGSTSLVFVGPGFGGNEILQALVSGDVLIADANEVRRWTPGALVPVPYWQGPPVFPNSIALVNSLARTPFNQIGSGAVIGHRTLDTFCLCGDGTAVTADLLGNNASVFATESYTLPDRGLAGVASGLRQDLYWATLVAAPGGGIALDVYRIRQVAAHGSHGSLLVDVGGGVMTVHFYGDPAGGDPLLVGVQLVPSPVPVGGIFIPPFGVLELNPLSPSYFPLLDGIGVFGPPNPFAVIPGGGHFVFALSVPPLNLSFRAEGVILDPQHAVNGSFTISNVDSFTL